MMHVIIHEELYNKDFVAQHTVGFTELAPHVNAYGPAWAAAITGVPAAHIVALARRYASTRPAMILIGGSSMHKGANGWQGGRAVACLPALTGNLGLPGGGLGPRHGSTSHGQALASIVPTTSHPPGTYIPNQMSSMIDALVDGRVRALLLFGTDMLSSFADSARLAAGLARTDLIVSHDLFMNETIRRFADVVLPGTSWLEQLGCKMTNTHLYLMEQALEPPGETRSLTSILQALADRLGLVAFFPWKAEEAMIDAILAHPSTGYATVADLRAEGGIRAMNISHVAYPDHRYHTPSGKVEFYSECARELGLPPLPVHEDMSSSPYPLTLCQGRTLTHFHGFYDHGRALPSLAKLDPAPRLWISPRDAIVRGLRDGAPIRIYNEHGEFQAYAQVTERIPSGTVWMRDGWEGLNRLTSGAPAIPDEAVDLFHFSAGQAAFDARVEVAPA
jgi:anaerobic selenocysteine-containing dehydrogenase